MSDTSVINIMTQMLLVTAKLSGPILATSLIVGLFVSILQSATQVQEVTLTFVPKLLVIALVLVFTGNWMMSVIVDFTQSLFDMIPDLIRSA